METLGTFPDGEWECFQRMFDIEEHDDSPQLLSQTLLPLGEDDGNFGIQSMFCSTPEAGGIKSMFYSFDSHNSNLQYISQENSHSSNCSGPTVFVANPGHTYCYFDYPGHVLASNSDRSENSDHIQVEPVVEQLITKQLKLKRVLDVPELEVHVEDKTNSCGNPKKKPRASRDVQRCMKNAESKKSHKVDRNGNEAEETNAGSDGHSSSSYTSEDHNTSEENSGGATSASKLPVALNLNGKTRASRGSATDPQSLYARKRRERINERLRILQNLVPKGTKVDISTMLEEAIHYVKFLQLQIKLLSSDDLWMYAPIACNGLDVGLNLSRKISPPL